MIKLDMVFFEPRDEKRLDQCECGSDGKMHKMFCWQPASLHLGEALRLIISGQ